VPTTPTIASIIGAMQSQEALKLLHGMPVESGKVTHFNGMTNEMHTAAYLPREDCESHWTYGEITELPARAETTTLGDLLKIARSDLGPDAILELDQELILTLRCPNCHTVEQILQPISQVSFEFAHCPACGALRETEMTHAITGDENFLGRTLASVGVPPLHIMRAFNTREYRFYELTGDLPTALHFRDFEEPSPTRKEAIRNRIRLGDTERSNERHRSPAKGRIVIKD
jgi:adenylyltransferase/sulfurtransferase